MAYRFDAAADRISRTATVINYNAAYTWMGWALLNSDLNAYNCIFTINVNNPAANMDYVGIGSNGTTITMLMDVGGTYTEITGDFSFTVGQWRHICIVRSSTTSLALYVDGVADDDILASNVSGRTASTRMEMGGFGTGNADRFDGRLFAVKMWDTNLSVAEIQAEMRTIRPIRFANLWAWLPGLGTDVNDYSGNGRNFTGTGITEEQNAPVAWGTFPQLFRQAIAGGGGPTTYYETINTTVTAAQTRLLNIFNRRSNTVTATQGHTKRVVMARNNAVTAAQTTIKRPLVRRADTSTVTQSRTIQALIRRNNAVTGTQSRSLRVLLARTNIVTATQIRSLTARLSRANTVTGTNSNRIMPRIVRSNTVSATQTSRKTINKLITNAVTATQSRILDITKTVTNTVTVTQGRVLRVIKSAFANAVTAATSVTSRLVQIVTVNVGVTVNQLLSKRVFIRRNNSVTAAQSRQLLIDIVRNNSVTITQGLVQRIVIVRNNAVTGSQTRTLQVNKGINTAITATQNSIKIIRKIVTNAVSVVQSVSTVIIPGGAFVISRAINYIRRTQTYNRATQIIRSFNKGSRTHTYQGDDE